MIKPMNNDIFIKKIEASAKSKSSILEVVESNEDDRLVTWEVTAVSDNVTEVKAGDKVIAPWDRVTPPIDVSTDGLTGDLIGVTDIKEVFAVFED